MIADGVQNVGQMTRARTDIQDRGGDTEDVVDLARMHQPYEGIAHNRDVQVSGGQRRRELLQRLVGKAVDGCELMVES